MAVRRLQLAISQSLLSSNPFPACFFVIEVVSVTECFSYRVFQLPGVSVTECFSYRVFSPVRTVQYYIHFIISTMQYCTFSLDLHCLLYNIYNFCVYFFDEKLLGKKLL